MAFPIPQDRFDALKPKFEGKTCCVTGGAGFIGGHLVETLVGLGASVRVIDDLSTSTLDALAPLVDRHPERLHVVRGSILDDSALAAAIDRSSVVFHCAALSSIPRSVEHPERTWTVNTTGTLRVLAAAHSAGVRRVVYSASSSAYGNAPGLPKHEDQAPAPVSPYGASKLAAEHLCAAFSDTYGLSTVSLRYFNVFGPRQRSDTAYAGVIPSFASRVLTGEPPRVFGDGEQTRDFTFVANVVLGNLLAASSDRPLAGEVYNTATGSRITINDLAARVIAKFATSPMEPEHADSRPGEVRHSHADIAKIREHFGYDPIANFESGLDVTLDWYRDTNSSSGAAVEGQR